MTDPTTWVPTSVTVAPDGRTIAYSEFGDPDGVPVLFFHGLPSNRTQGAGLHEPAAEANVRLVALDRPGFGRSDPHPARSIRGYAADVAAVADALDIDRFGVLGVSGGGAFALACGHEIPDRLTCVGLVGGVGPFSEHPETQRDMNPGLRQLFMMSALPAPLSRATSYATTLYQKARTKLDAQYLIKQRQKIIATLPEKEREAQTDPEKAMKTAALMGEALRQGNEPFRLECSLVWRPWGFRLEHVRAHVELWHGSEDTNVPTSLARHVARRLPDCTPHFVPGAHVVWAYNEGLDHEVFRTLAKAAD